MKATTASKPPLRLGRRLLGSQLVDVLVGPHGVDRYLELIRPTWSLSDRRAEVVGVERGTPDSVTLTLRANGAWEGFRAGQFVQVAVQVDGAWRTRCYSPSSAEGVGRRLELTVKAHPGGVVSNFLNERARPGMVLGLSEADGDFQLSDPRPERVLLISGGSGITPVISILRTLCAEGHSAPVTFLHYARDREHTIYGGELERIAAAHPNVGLVRSFTRDPGAGELDGHFRREHLTKAAPDFAAAETFACGPPALLDAVRSTWATKGIERRLHIESFLPPAMAAPSGDASGEIHFARSDLRVENSGAPLLEQAERAGLEPEYGCRQGVCHSCACRKTAGSVRNLTTGALSEPDAEEIQLCISEPVGDVAIDL